MADQLHLTVKRCLERYRFFSLKQPLVVAVSTGVDSMALLHVLGSLLSADQLVVAHVNHHLRAQSQQEEQFLRQQCQQMGVQLYVDQWKNHPQHGIENAAPPLLAFVKPGRLRMDSYCALFCELPKNP